jgi:hypothetical protein
LDFQIQPFAVNSTVRGCVSGDEFVFDRTPVMARVMPMTKKWLEDVNFSYEKLWRIGIGRDAATTTGNVGFSNGQFEFDRQSNAARPQCREPKLELCG